MTSLCRPTGRRQTAERLAYARMAAEAELGQVSRTRLFQLVEDLVRIKLIDATDSHLLNLLIRTTSEASFQKGGMPLVFKSNRHLADQTGISEGRVSRRLSRLLDLGLIAMQDSGNYKRHAAYDESGALVGGCGVDLRLLVARYDELNSMVRVHADRQRMLNQIWTRYSGACRAFRLALASAGQGPAFAGLLQRRYEAIRAAIGARRAADPRRLTRALKLIERLTARLFGVEHTAQQAAQQAPETADSTCRHAAGDMHIHITNPNHPGICNDERRPAHAGHQNNADGGSAAEWAFEESLLAGPAPVKPIAASEITVRVEDVLRAVPAMREYFSEVPRSWADLCRLAASTCRIIGISPAAHREAVARMGEVQAAAAVLITLQKSQAGDVASPGGYLRAMTERAGRGELHLTRSIFGLAAGASRRPQ